MAKTTWEKKIRGKEKTFFFFVPAVASSFYNEGQPSSWLSYVFVLGVEFTALLNDL